MICTTAADQNKYYWHTGYHNVFRWNGKHLSFVVPSLERPGGDEYISPWWQPVAPDSWTGWRTNPDLHAVPRLYVRLSGVLHIREHPG